VIFRLSTSYSLKVRILDEVVILQKSDFTVEAYSKFGDQKPIFQQFVSATTSPGNENCNIAYLSLKIW
jgi:hypothetical protein